MFILNQFPIFTQNSEWIFYRPSEWQLWDGTDFSNEVIERDHQVWVAQGENDFIISIGSALYFCLKYLTPSEMETWCESLFQINGIHWHYNLMHWLYHETFSLFLHFEDDGLPETYAVHPNFHVGVNARVTTIYLPTVNVKLFIQMLKDHRIYYGKMD